jgi:hypothetical protein
MMDLPPAKEPLRAIAARYLSLLSEWSLRQAAGSISTSATSVDAHPGNFSNIIGFLESHDVRVTANAPDVEYSQPPVQLPGTAAGDAES